MAEIEPGSGNGQDPVEMFMSLDSWPSSPLDAGPSSPCPVDMFMSLDCWPLPPLDAGPSSPSPGENLLVGFVIADVVGLRCREVRISHRGAVGLVRDDGNAIKVLNVRSVQVGLIEPCAAAVLSPLIDCRLITVGGFVPKPLEKGSRFKVPCQIHIFAKAEEFIKVKVQIAVSGLQLISETNASLTLSESMAVKEKNCIVAKKSVDQIFKHLDLKVSNEGVSKSLEPPKDMIKSELFPHQKEGLGWLVSRECSNELPPFWEEKKGGYMNELTDYQTDTRPEPMRGGIFADDTGSGKTLTLLSLIALDKSPAGNSSIYAVDDDDDDNNSEEDENIVFLGKATKRGIGSKKKVNSSAKKRKTEDMDTAKKKGKRPILEKTSPLEPKTTLIVCPPSVFSAWMTQLEEHTRKGVFKVYMYYGERTKDAKELQKHDIVLTTYSTLASEESWDKSPIKGMEWRRVILDEVHMIKNVNTRQSRAVSKLNAKRRWAVTGTPLQNNSFYSFSLAVFLKFEPLSKKSLWHSLIQRPLARGNEKGGSRLQVLMSAISLRRTKDKALVGLPSKCIETVYVTLREEEHRVYDQMEEEAKNIVKVYILNGSIIRNYSTVLSILIRLRQICIDLALCPAHLRALLTKYQIEDVKNNPILLQKLVSVLQDGEDINCPICISPPTHIVITCCAHIFCESCIVKTLKRAKRRCPMCRHPLSESSLFKAPPEPSPLPGAKNSSTRVSSKVDALLKLLTSSRDAKPFSKSVVFSQFRKMLLLLEEPLKEAGFNVTRLDGSMDAKKRTQVIREFNIPAPEGPVILLASLKSSSAGINLTAASTVYLLEPWWNPEAEDQAMDRVHRIGQVENVRVVRLITRNTIEERVLQVQENKRALARKGFGRTGQALARKAFGRTGQKDGREISRYDLGALLNF